MATSRELFHDIQPNIVVRGMLVFRRKQYLRAIQSIYAAWPTLYRIDHSFVFVCIDAVTWWIRELDLARSDDISPHPVIQDNHIPYHFITAILMQVPFCVSSSPALQQGEPNRSDEKVPNTYIFGVRIWYGTSELSSDERDNGCYRPRGFRRAKDSVKTG